jgi:signal transduction histidine kinase
MRFRFLDARRAADWLRRQGPITALAILAIVGLVALGAFGVAERRSEQARFARQSIAASVAAAQAILDREQRGLDRLAAVGATSNDAAVQLLLDQMPSLTPGTRAAALFDATGTLMLRSAGPSAGDQLAALGDEAAKQAAVRPPAAMIVTGPVRDAAGEPLIGLARPWQDVEGNISGFALVALDPSAFAGLDLVRDDGTPLFGDKSPMSDARYVARGDFPLKLQVAVASPTAWGVLRHAWPFVAIAVIGGGAMLSLLALLVGRLHVAERENARQADVADDLRRELAVATAAADRHGELSRAKSQFFAQVTHELRTPLNAILGFSETIRHQMFGPVANPRYLEYAGLIHDAGAHLLSLINDLLDNARIEAGKMEIAPIRVAAPALARSALDLVEMLAEDRDIALATSGLAGCPDLNVDPRAMKQVLVNLLSNAIKYTPPGGRIELSFAERDDGGVAIKIADTGIGMSADDLQRVFEPFGRASAIEARRQQGTGLGLSLARALVRLHGGELTLESRVSFGTTATVTLPASVAFGATALKSETKTASARAA